MKCEHNLPVSTQGLCTLSLVLKSSTGSKVSKGAFTITNTHRLHRYIYVCLKLISDVVNLSLKVCCIMYDNCV